MKAFFNRMKMAYIFWWGRRLPACDELLPLMSQRMDGVLPWRKRLMLALHNHICEWCRRYAKQLLVIREAMQQKKSETHGVESLSDAARDRMRRALQQNQN